jgi:hypothetical protein
MTSPIENVNVFLAAWSAMIIGDDNQICVKKVGM